MFAERLEHIATIDVRGFNHDAVGIDVQDFDAFWHAQQKIEVVGKPISECPGFLDIGKLPLD